MKISNIIHLITILFTLLIISFKTQAQTDSRNGDYWSPHGTIKTFVVFADIYDDNNDSSYVDPGWLYGELPLFKDSLFNQDSSGSIKGFISTYYREASFGDFRLIGDYYPQLIKVKKSEQASIDGCDNIIDTLDKLSENIFLSNLSDYDNWRPTANQKPKLNEKDTLLDILVIIWRKNSRLYNYTNGGVSHDGTIQRALRNLKGLNSYVATLCSNRNLIIRHEIAHFIVGDNNYHSGGAGAGNGHFMSNVGGYSILSSYNRNIETYNAWDRWWLGWKNPDNSYEISARNVYGREVYGDLTYGVDIGDGLFVLRDFAKYGDAIRIKLPHLKDINDTTKNQYLWLENRQLNSVSEKYEYVVPKGLRMNIQIGNDDRIQNYGDSRTNYYYPLSAFGCYDMAFPGMINNNYIAHTNALRQNPLTGSSLLMLPAEDLDGDDEIKAKETYLPWKFFFNEAQMFGLYPSFGNSYDVFCKGRSLSLSSNPSTSALLTHLVSRPNGPDTYTPLDPKSDDNRYVYLNGLRVDVVDERPDGSVLVRISWDDYRVCDNVRWCGPIVLSDEIDLLPSYSIVLDQGLTPTQPKIIDNLGLFAKPTVLHCRRQSTFTQREGSKVVVKNNSTLLIDTGAVYEILDGAKLEIEPTGSLIVRSGASLSMRGTGRVVIDSGAYLCVEDSNSINISGSTGAIYLEDDYILGSNQVSGYASTNCLSTIYISTSGRFRDLQSPSDRYIQNITYTAGNHLETGGQINAGYDITTAVSNGYVVVPSGANVTMDAENGVSLQWGVRVEQGGTLRIR